MLLAQNFSAVSLFSMFCRVLQDDLDLAHTVNDYLIGRFRNKISKKDKDANSFIDQDNFPKFKCRIIELSWTGRADSPFEGLLSFI